MNVQSLRNIDVNRYTSVDDLVVGLAHAKLIRAEYAANTLQAPEFVEDAVNALSKEIASRRHDYLVQRRKTLQAQREALKTTAEKRKGIEDELAELEKELG